MYGKNARAMSFSLCESPNYKYGTVYIGFWLPPRSHFPESHVFHALIFTSQWNCFSIFTKLFACLMASIHKQEFSLLLHKNSYMYSKESTHKEEWRHG